MNVFVIPAWYPSAAAPIAGSFIKEQTRCYAELNPRDNVIVSVACMGAYPLAVRTPFKSLRTLATYLKGSGVSEIRCQNHCELHASVLQWSPRLGGGNVNGFLHAHLANFRRAEETFGPIDIIHAHVSYPAGWWALMIAQKMHRPYIITEHMGPFPFDNPLLIRDGKLTERLSRPLASAGAIVAVGRSLAKAIFSYGFNKLCVIPNMVDETLFYPVTAEKDRHVRFNFLTVAALIPEKGISELLHAIKEVVAVCADCCFRIVGDGPSSGQFRTLASELGIDAHLQWSGKVVRQDMPAIYQEADAYVLPSRHESFGISYVEALACGKPVIATRCGGPEDFVTESNGIMVERGDIDGLARAMLTMVKERGRYDSAVIRTDFMRQFSRPAVVEQIRQLYLKTIAAS